MWADSGIIVRFQPTVDVMVASARPAADHRELTARHAALANNRLAFNVVVICAALVF